LWVGGVAAFTSVTVTTTFDLRSASTTRLFMAQDVDVFR
jgi:hypothetical protein